MPYPVELVKLLVSGDSTRLVVRRLELAFMPSVGMTLSGLLADPEDRDTIKGIDHDIRRGVTTIDLGDEVAVEETTMAELVEFCGPWWAARREGTLDGDRVVTAAPDGPSATDHGLRLRRLVDLVDQPDLAADIRRAAMALGGEVTRLRQELQMSLAAVVGAEAPKSEATP